MGDRIWIDNPYCKPFVDNIVTAFNTHQPPRSLLASETWMPTARDTGSPLTIVNLDDDDGKYLILCRLIKLKIHFQQIVNIRL